MYLWNHFTWQWGKTCFQLGNHSNFMLVDQRKRGLKHFWPGDDIPHCVLGHDGWTPPDLSTYTLGFLAALAGRASFWPWMNTSRPCRCQVQPQTDPLAAGIMASWAYLGHLSRTQSFKGLFPSKVQQFSGPGALQRYLVDS